MDFHDSPEERAYRSTLRGWLAEVVPSLSSAHLGGRASLPSLGRPREWQRMLYDAGYIGQTWPVEIGGRGLSPVFDYILNEECAAAGAPAPPASLNYLGRSIAAFGSPPQRERFLTPTMSGEIRWCQGFSEPSGGSDLAGLRTAARREGEEYVVDGEKLWTSGAQVADWCFLLVRTDPAAPRHKGISVLLVDMATPGITPHGVRTADGAVHTSGCFFDGVRVPAGNMLGAPGDGWRIAMSALSYERGPADVGVLSVMMRQVAEIEHEAAELGLLSDPRIRSAAADAYVHSQVLRLSALRQLSLRALDRPAEGEGPIAKILWSTAEQRIAQVGLEVAGADAVTGSAPAARDRYLESRQASVYGGTVQIQRNLLAQRTMGLPRT